MSEAIIVAVISAALGGGGFVELIRWVADRRSKNLRKDNLRETLEAALADSPTLQALQAHVLDNEKKLNSDFERFQRLEEQMHAIRACTLRHMLFTQPLDRNGHEAALEAGAEYLQCGYNGVGHIRYDQLKEDYRRRTEAGDWDYPGGKGKKPELQS